MSRPRGMQEPQYILSVVLGDYWFGQRDFLPASALAALLAEFGITAGSARQAMLRLHRRGILDRRGSGKRFWYGYHPRSDEIIRSRLARIFEFGKPVEGWDGQWTIAMFSGEGNAAARSLLRTALRNLGFGIMQDAVWGSPFDRTARVRELFSNSEISTWQVLRAQDLGGSDGALTGRRVFDLERLESEYRQFIDQHMEVSRTLETPNPLEYRTWVMNQWLYLREQDPELPRELLGDEWIGYAARRVFLDVYDGLGASAADRFRTIVAASAPELAAHATHHTSSIALSRGPRQDGEGTATVNLY